MDYSSVEESAVQEIMAIMRCMTGAEIASMLEAQGQAQERGEPLPPIPAVYRTRLALKRAADRLNVAVEKLNAEDAGELVKPPTPPTPPLMIDASELKLCVQDADNAWQTVIREDEYWHVIQEKSFAIPPDPADTLALKEQTEVVKVAKATHAYASGLVIAKLRTAIIAAEVHEAHRAS
ncbi:hypothetical protein [Pseudomonas sp. UMAB-40]|uniref:hypothetical protein n=1 Tax=Pseudomonas sp. UMAB-40 TaxID=1365407 RepID=UPI001C5806A2|nr:hypothetical protein [Pseudomonas sp. UMAB-40]